MPAINLPIYHRIVFRLLLPVVGVGVLVATVLVAYMAAPMKSFLRHQFDANLRLAATMGLGACEESLNYLLELRLEKNVEMNRVMQNEVVEKVRAISDHFPYTHMMIVRTDKSVIACHEVDAPATWEGPLPAATSDTPLTFALGGKAVRAHAQFFPFWDWHIVSFVFEEALESPLRMAYRTTFLSTVGVFAAVLITLLGVFHLFIKAPLNRLVAATDRVAKGKMFRLVDIPRSEFGRLMHSFNAMVDSLEAEQAEVNRLIHQLTSIYNTLPVIVWALDEAGRFTLSEGKQLEVLGLKPGQVVGMSAEEVYAGNSGVLDGVRRSLNGEACEIEVQVQGHTFHAVLTPIFDDAHAVRGMRGLAINITDKKRAEEELHQLRNYLSNIIDSMPSVLIGVDMEGKVTQWNSEAQRVTGVTPEAARGRPLEQVFPELAEEMARIHDAIATREVRSELRKARREDGQARYANVTVYPLVANGVEGAVIRVDDVTEQVRLEELMIQSEKMLSVGGLAAGMAHEINNPLAGILQNTAVVINRFSSDLPANHKAAAAAGTSMDAIQQYMALRKLPEMLENINKSGSMAAAIVKNMLSFARKSEGVASSHELGELLDQALELLKTDYDMKRRYDFKQMPITRDYDDTAGPVPCEASKLQQVFMNILKNGAEAMAEAAQTVPQPSFVLRVVDDGPFVRVEIEDNGPGMDEKTRRRIFEPFFTTKPTGEGTGLGLSVSYFIIADDHGGEMWVQPTEDGGSCFVIRLPKHGKP